MKNYYIYKTNGYVQLNLLSLQVTRPLHVVYIKKLLLQGMLLLFLGFSLGLKKKMTKR